MSYGSEVLERVKRQNPDQPEFIQAVTEVLETLAPVIDRNEARYRREALLERLTTREAKEAWIPPAGETVISFSGGLPLLRIMTV